MSSPLRKTRRSSNEAGHLHFLTFSCWKRWPLLSKDRSREWCIDALESTRRELDVAIVAYVIMPEHLHLLVWPRRRDYEVRRILAAIKSPVSRQAKAHLVATEQRAWLDRLTARHGDRTVFRFWQPGGGFDKNLWSDRPIENVIAYIHANPVRRGLVDRPTDWFWSSAAAHAGLRATPIAVDSIRID